MITKIKKKIMCLYKTRYVYLFNIGFFLISLVVIYFSLSYHMATMSLKSIKVIGEIKKNKVEIFLENFRYESLLYSTDPDIISMDKEKIVKKLDFVKFYRSFYKDIIVINNDKQLLSGYVDNVKEYMYRDYVIEALKGKMSISQPINNEGHWYIDFVSPIISGDKRLGIICLRVSLLELSGSLKGEKQDKNLEAFIVDKEGYYLTSGKGGIRKIGEDNIDIKSIKIQMDYAPKTPYKNYSGSYVYGEYYNLSLGGWTLVVENLHDKSTLYLMVSIGMGIVLFVQFLMNKLINVSRKHSPKD